MKPIPTEYTFAKKFSKLKNLAKETLSYATPKKPSTTHNRISMITAKIQKPLTKESGTFSKTATSHQKSESLPVNTKNYKKIIEKNNKTQDRRKYTSKISTRTTSFNNPENEDSISVSCSSEDSLAVLQKQVSCVKKLAENEPSKIKSYKLCCSVISIRDLSRLDKTHAKSFQKSNKFSEMCMLYSIPAIRPN